MAFLISETKDQAILTMVIQEASKIAKQKDKYVGRTALQKILYFLKVLDVKISYRFEIYHYGPFCSEILNDVDILMADEVIKDISSTPDKYSNYEPSINADELLAKHKDIEDVRAKVRLLVNALIPCTPEQLELLATLDYLYRWFKASGGSGPYKEMIVNELLRIKDKFDKESVSKYYDVLVKAKLIEE